MKRLNSKCLFFDRYHDFMIMLCIFFIVILISSFIFMSIFVKFDFSTSFNGVVVKEDDFYVSVVISDNDLRWIQNSLLVVDKNRVDFSIVKISDEYVLSSGGPMRCVYLKFDFDDRYKIINNVVKLNFVSRKTIFSKLKEVI